eukprot:CAMPEP_0180825674 /NCGR_PEP_ID=MMETSP1038_2-20121128/73109_1 /TAXON_ID=632150 /ORGANISM="Azadinium spinosum, Strain 3D9" /LENGTH=37 /DNA_ID= /DNA_START= /DNA_END= /DNA_ORIENTATION=
MEANLSLKLAPKCAATLTVVMRVGKIGLTVMEANAAR